MTSYPTPSAPPTKHRSTLLGHDLAEGLLGNVGFAELAFWLVALRRPTTPTWIC